MTLNESLLYSLQNISVKENIKLHFEQKKYYRLTT